MVRFEVSDLDTDYIGSFTVKCTNGNAVFTTKDLPAGEYILWAEFVPYAESCYNSVSMPLDGPWTLFTIVG